MNMPGISLWKEAPFLRLCLPFIAGILIQNYTANPAWINYVLLSISLAGCGIFSISPLKIKFQYYWINGVLVQLLIAAAGGILGHCKNPFQPEQLVDRIRTDSSIYLVTLLEPLTEKRNSWKSLALLNSITNGDTIHSPKTFVILYFRKDSAGIKPGYGNRIAFKKPLQKIKNNTATGSFDYEWYCALKNIHFQVFLKPGDYISIPGNYSGPVSDFIFTIRAWVIGVIRKNITGVKECGLALALLIGYKDELDKGLIQSYSNTGVVHVIAISGLHLGLIYTLLSCICAPFGKKGPGRWLSPLIIITGLWIFSLLAGASPSVLRSAVMFTAIVAGKAITRRSSIINNLSASAFFLLCYDPFWLWDTGFILSYSALLGIVVFMKPIYHLFMIKNKAVDAIWKLNAVTLSAQILTMPVIIYYFKQFPNLFLLTNLIAIPLSGIILTGEIILCAMYYFETPASQIGWLLSQLIKYMNVSVELIDSLGFSSTRGLDINFAQLILLYVFIALISRWLILHLKNNLFAAIISAIVFSIAGTLKIWQ